MTVIRRLALYAALPLVLVAVAGYGWYQFSDTGKRWRYEDALAGYCQGLIPAEESAVLTGYDTDAGLPLDYRDGGPGGYEFCKVGRHTLVIAEIPADARDDDGRPGVFDRLRPSPTGTLPLPLGGGWHGYTNRVSAAVVLTCAGRESSVVVGSQTGGDTVAGSAVARLLTATAERAADRWDCDAQTGGATPDDYPEPQEKSRFEAEGTCAGLPLRDRDDIDWIRETTAAPGTAPLESCVLGAARDAESRPELFGLTASFGPFAQAVAPLGDGADPEAGRLGDLLWGTAACPGDGARARFTLDPASPAGEGDDAFARAALAAFAERAAKQHGCTGLRLPD
ncbi:hypothetical protein [Streptomyces genisteinicus]|uniref:Uncharacterized protein n=1 Tax=Streptomyces genisteinicus TaxID=2768068 RepID=A0A7H0HM46_9ACTN|nr:hypothetical protein [Streptomyces genisteinicus]QNP61612.1 hypothetical protein IAG43_00855 [Streptomyces genisteinicus]